MAFFDRFKRKRTASVLPQEVDEYYRAEKRGRRGAAFLLGLMTLVLTVLFVLGVFFVGKYFYNKVRDNSNDTASISTPSEKDKDAAAKKSSDDKSSSSDTSTDTSTGGSGTTNSGGSAATTQAPTPPPPATPNTGDSIPSTSLPRTGDEGM